MKTELEQAQHQMNTIIEDIGPTPNVVDWCDGEVAYGYWARKAKQLSKKRQRVANRRERVARTFEAWDVAKNRHPDDVAFWLRMAIQADQVYFPEAWPVKGTP